MRSRFPYVIALLAALAGSRAAGQPEPAGVVWKPGFGRASIWNDGNAEVSTYRASDMRYGIPRTSRAALIVVAEDLDRDKLVKVERVGGEPRTLRVLKLNHVRSIQTGVYVYNQMLSAFLAADRLDPVKFTMTSHEWCGNSFVEWRSDRKTLAIRSYFESVADQDVPLDPGGALFYDTLPLALRALDFEATREGRLRVLSTLFASAPAPPVAEEAVLRCAAGPGSTHRVTLDRGPRRDILDFERTFPHRLVRWERPDGGLLTLIDSRRFPYWQKNHPGDEKLLPPSSGR
ncbi:MAG TPA: hypothetical protein VGS00_04810 [Thermoanaerobaculia bacterium]|nr:hypothetical protein [Thermoanaerobaculia bacterium]